MKRTYLTESFVNEFCRQTDNARLCDIVDNIKHRTNQRFNGSYSAIFSQLVKDGTLQFEFDEDNEPDSDGEINGVQIVYIRNVTNDPFIVKRGYMSHFVTKLPTQKPTGATKMSQVTNKAKQIGGGMVAANKQAFGMAASMQTGRANNKVIKEAVRPLVKLMFKPSFMQRILAKLFKTENPIDKFLDSPYGSLFAAQLAQGIVTMKGVENENVKKVTVGGIAYAYNELADEIVPLEKAIDSVVDKISEAAKLVK